MYSKIFIILSLSIIFSNSVCSQNVTLDWANRIGNTELESISDMVTSSYGTIYSAGSYEGTVDFDPGLGIYNLTSGINHGHYLASYSSNGDLNWAMNMLLDISIEDIEADPSGNIIVAGYFYNNGAEDAILWKFSPSGTSIWVKDFGGILDDHAEAISIDASGNIFVTGSFVDSVDFDPGPGVFNMYSPINSSNAYVSKFDASGNFIWACHFGSPSVSNGASAARCIKLDDAGYIYVGGGFTDTVDFDPGSGIYEIIGINDAFFVKLDPSGNLLWAGSVNGPDYEDVRSIATDVSGNLYASGHFFGTADFDPGAGIYNLTSIQASHPDIYIMKLNSAGSLTWAGSIGSYYSDFINKLLLDRFGNVYISGNFTGTIDTDPGAGLFNMTSAGMSEGFILKLLNNGSFFWAIQLGGSGAAQCGVGVSLDNHGKLYGFGGFNDTCDFEPGAGVSNLIAQGVYPDIFLAKWNQCNETFASLSPTACNFYLSPSGNYTWNVSGTYTDTISNAEGCDSILTINLTILQGPTPAITGITSICAGSSTTLCATLATCYLWSTGDTTQCINVSLAGSYTVTVCDVNGCTGTTTTIVTVNPLPIPVITGDSTLCSGQTAVLDAGAMYSGYFWNTSAFSQTTTVNTTGTYTVTVTDVNGCTGTDSIQVTGPQAFISGNTTICQGMSANLTVAFTGNGPFTYSYHDGAINYGPFTTIQNPTTINVSPVGNTCYSLLTFSDNNCAGTVSGMACITVYPIPQATLTGSVTMCEGDTTDIVASFMGPPPCQYSYTDGTNQYGPYTTNNTIAIIPVSPSVTTTYSLTYFANANCVGNVSGSATVTIDPSPTPTIFGDSTLCPGQSTNLIAGAGWAGYLWSNGSTAQILTTSILGTYTVTVTNPNGCTGSDSITLIAAPPYTTVLTASGPVGICQGDSVQLSLQSPMVSYQWFKNNVAIPGATNPSLWVSAAGNYKCSSVDSAGCDAISNQKRVSIICFPPQPAEEKLQSENYSFEIFPNPTRENFTIRFDYKVEEPVTVNIFELSGKKVLTTSVSTNSSEINISSLQAGCYFVELLYQDGNCFRRRMIVY